MSIDGKTFLATQNKWRKELLHHGWIDLQIKIRGKHRKLTHTLKSTNHYFCVVSRKITLCLRKGFDDQSCGDEKKVWLAWGILNDERVQKARTTSPFLTLGSSCAIPRSFFILFAKGFWYSYIYWSLDWESELDVSRGLLSIVKLIWGWWLFELMRTTSRILTLRSSWTTPRSFHQFYWKVLNSG